MRISTLFNLAALATSLILTGCPGSSGGGAAPTAPALSFSAGTLDYGVVVVGATADLSVTATNTGGGTVSGQLFLPTSYSLVGGSDTYNLGAGQSQSFTIRFTPLSNGTFSGDATFIGGGIIGRVFLTGEGQLNPAIQVTPTSLDYGVVATGTASDETFTVKNTGGGTLSGTVTTSAPFSVVGSATYSLGANATQTITIRFQSSTTGTFSGTASCTGAAGASVSLDAVAEEPPELDVSASSIDFGLVGQGDTADKTFDVTNTGGTTLSGSVSASAPFSVVGSASYALTAGQSKTITLRFTPTSSGAVTRTATLTGAGGGSITLTGTGDAASAISLSTTTLSFGSVEIGQSLPLNVTVTNTGGGTLIGTVTTSSPFSVTGTASYSLGNGQSQTVTILFTPTAQGGSTRTATFPGGGGGSVTLSGTGVLPPAISASTTLLDFSSVAVGFSADLTFSVTNSGGGTLTGTASISSPFSIVGGSPYSLGQGSSQTITVRFSPSVGGTATGTITCTGAAGATLTARGFGGAPPQLQVNPATLAFGETVLGTTAELTVEVSNTGGAPLSGSATTSAPFSIVTSTASYSLDAGQKQTIRVQFRPVDTKSVSGLMDLTGGAGATVALSGSGAVNVYWADPSGKIGRAKLDGTNVTVTATGGTPVRVALDLDQGKLFWTDSQRRAIRTASLDASGAADLVATTGAPHGIAIDPIAAEVYWTEPGNGTINKAAVNGTGAATVLTLTGQAPSGLAIDVGARKMYWSDEGVGRVQRANLDGTGKEDVVGSVAPLGLGVDNARGKVYWTDSALNRVRRANLDGTGLEDLFTGGEPTGLALDLSAGKIYWTDTNLGILRRTDLDGTDIENLVTAINPTGTAVAVAPTVILTPSTLDFNTVEVGLTKTLDVLVTNVSSASVTGSASVALPFVVSPTSTFVGFSLAAGQSTTIPVSFEPRDKGLVTSTAVFGLTTGGAAPAALSGIGFVTQTTIVVDQVAARPGDAVTVPVRMLRAPLPIVDPSTVAFRVKFDGSALTLSSVTLGDIATNAGKDVLFSPTTAESVNVVVTEIGSQAEMNEDGILVNLNFTVRGAARAGAVQFLFESGSLASGRGDRFTDRNLIGGRLVIE